MRKTLFSTLVLILFISGIKAQQWTVFSTQHIFSIVFMNSNTGFFGGGSGLWKTTNAGENFVQVPGTLPGVAELDYKNGVLYVVSTDLHYNYLQKSTNQGASWQNINNALTGPIYISDANQIMAAWDRKVYFADDGINFSQIFNQQYAFPFNITGLFMHNGKRFISTKNQFCVNSGLDTNWVRREYTNFLCESEPAIYGNKIYVGGSRLETAVIQYTTNEGIDWNTVMEADGICHSIVFDNEEGFAIVNKQYNSDSTLSTIYRSADGLSWIPVYQTVVQHNGGWSPFGLWDIEFTPAYVYFGGWNTFLRYERNPLGIDPQGEIPENYELKQNYPNPFNPETKINFSIPKRSNISITVHDISGKEIKTLISGVQEAGEHEVSFNASNLSSGVYFYVLKSESFMETKKMILIK